MKFYSLFLFTSISALAAVEPLRCFQISGSDGSSMVMRVQEESLDRYQIQIDSPDSSGPILPSVIFDSLSEDSPDETNNDIFSWRQGSNIVNIQFKGSQDSGMLTLSMRSLMHDEVMEFEGNYVKIPCA